MSDYKLHDKQTSGKLNCKSHFTKGDVNLGYILFTHKGEVLPMVAEHCNGDDLIAFGKALNTVVKL